MTFTVLGAIAELERSLIIERVKAASFRPIEDLTGPTLLEISEYATSQELTVFKARTEVGVGRLLLLSHRSAGRSNRDDEKTVL